MSAEKKQKRRSSFTANRISLVSRDVSSAADLHKMVEEELSKEDRLAKLTRLTLQYTLSMLEKEFKDSDWFDQFNSSAVESVNEVISRLQDEDIFNHACSKKQELPNPTNEAFDVNIAAAEQRINVLEEECQKWDSYLEQLKDEKEAAEKKSGNLELKASSLSDKVKELATSNYLKPRPDYEGLINETQDHINKAALQMESYCNTVSLLERANKLANGVEEQLTHQLYKESFKGITSQNSMDQITNLTSLPSPTKKTKSSSTDL